MSKRRGPLEIRKDNLDKVWQFLFPHSKIQYLFIEIIGCHIDYEDRDIKYWEFIFQCKDPRLGVYDEHVHAFNEGEWVQFDMAGKIEILPRDKVVGR